jgi:2TM domain
MSTSAAVADDRVLESRARRRVGMKLGFYIHALIYVLVNTGLFVIDTVTGGHRWSHVPLMGWGLGLAIHGLVTLFNLQGQGLRERMLRSEIERLRERS